MDVIHECHEIKHQLKHSNVSLRFPSILEVLLKSGTSFGDWVNLLSHSENDPCKFQVQKSLKVTIKFEGSNINVIHQQKKVSFTSQLAVFGNIVYFTKSHM